MLRSNLGSSLTNIQVETGYREEYGNRMWKSLVLGCDGGEQKTIQPEMRNALKDYRATQTKNVAY